MIQEHDKAAALAITTALYAARLAKMDPAQLTPEQSRQFVVDASREAAHILAAVNRHIPKTERSFRPMTIH